MDPVTLPAGKSWPRPSLQSMQPVAVEQSSTLPRVLATTPTRRATTEGMRLPGDFPTLSEKEETEMPVSLTWLDKWEQGDSRGTSRGTSPLPNNSTHGELYPRGALLTGPEGTPRLTSRLDRVLGLRSGLGDAAPLRCLQPCDDCQSGQSQASPSSHDDFGNVVGGWFLV